MSAPWKVSLVSTKGGHHHGERLSTAGLAVGKDGAVVAVQDIVHGRLDTILEYVLLLGRHVKTPIERERVFPGIIPALRISLSPKHL